MKNLPEVITFAQYSYKGYDKTKGETDVQKFLDKTQSYFMRNSYYVRKICQHKDIFFFVAEKDNDIYICIRGTNSKQGWGRNFNIEKTDGKHSGFDEASEYIYDEFTKMSNVKNIIITAHSQGGSVGLILSNKLFENGYPIKEVYALEPANISSKKYINKTENYPIKRYIVKNNLSIIPSLPPKQLGYNNYKEVVLYFDRNDQLIINPSSYSVFLDKLMTLSNPKNWIENVTDHDLAYMLKSTVMNLELINNYVKAGVL